MCEGEKEKVEGWHARPIKGCKTSRPPPSWALDGNCKAAHLLTTARLSYKKPQCSCAKHNRCECARGRAQVCKCAKTLVRPSQTQPAAANMSGARRKRSSSRRGRPPQIPTRRSPSPHHLEGCYERGHTDGLCEGVYDKGRLDGYNEGMNAHFRQEESDEEDKRQVWTGVRRERKDSGSSDSGDSDDSTNSSGSSESEQSDSNDEDNGKKR